MKRLLLVSAVCLVVAFDAAGQATTSAWVYPSATGNLLYQLDEHGQRIADFSNCGYLTGTAALPNVSAVIPQSRWVYVSATTGDCRALIQNAINTVSAMTPDSNGWRGVVYLNAGEYQISSPGSGSLTEVQLLTSGSNYTSAPTVTITGGGSASAVTGTATISAGQVTGVTVSTSTNTYSSLPTVSISGGGGSGATAQAIITGSAGVSISAGGVVLKGAGSSSTTGTRLRATTPFQYSVVSVSGSGSGLFSGSGSRKAVSGTNNLTQNLVPAGTRTFQVDSSSNYNVGDTVIVHRPSTSNWITVINMDLLDIPWTAGLVDLYFDRVITRIDGNWITVDAPLPQTFDSQYGGGQVWKYNWNRIQQVGIEDIYGVSNYNTAITSSLSGVTYYSDEAHGWTFIYMDKVQNGWVRDITAQYFGYEAVGINSGAKWVTVADSQCLDAVSIITGSRRYSFHINDGDLILFQNDYARQGRHDFVLGSSVAGPSAYVQCTGTNAYADVGPHFHWSAGCLFDQITETGAPAGGDGSIDVQNRGNYGTNHGWAGAYCAVWNSSAAAFRVRNPPTARNWLIGSIGPILPSSAPVGADPEGTYDHSGPTGTGTNVYPQSLYYAQLQQRLKWPGSEFREAWLGSITQFTGTSVAVNCNSTWLAQVQTLGSADSNFDSMSNGYRAFTFDFSLDPGDTVVAASLTVSLRATGTTGSADTDSILLDGTGNSQTYASLGWTPISTSGTCVRTMEVNPSLLADGRLNVALGPHSAVDFAVLQYQVQKIPTYSPAPLIPEADAYVRGGTYANTNYGTATTLWTKDITPSSVNRESFIRWNLGGLSGTVLGAKVQLAVVGTGTTGTTGIQNCASLVSDNTWSETGITFNNKPSSGQPFATWNAVSGATVQFDVTSQVTNAIVGDGKLSLRIRSTGDYGGSGYVDYSSKEGATAPQLILSFQNTAPTISAIANQSIAVNGTAGALSFTVGDDFTPAASLTVTGTSSNTALVPSANILFSGTGGSRTVTVTPAANQLGSATITVNVSDGTLTTGSAFLLTVTGTPVETWRFANFGTTLSSGTASDTADPDGDGLVNLLEYALGGNPKAASSAPLPQASTIGGMLAITFTRILANNDITMTVQGADDVAGPWTDLASSVNGAAMTPLVGGVTVTETGTGATRSVEVRDFYLTSDPAHPRRFMRLKVTRP